METIKDAKEYLRNNFEEGAECPCCGQFVKQYSRLFDSGLARFAIALYRLTKGMSGLSRNKDDIRKRAGMEKLQATNYGIIEFWNIAVKTKNDDDSKRTSGLWKLTPKGVAFVEGRLLIPKYAKTYDNKCQGFSDTRITIKEALGNKFNYRELMER